MEVARKKINQKRPEMDPLDSTRLDAFLRVEGLVHLQHLRPKNPYNAKKHKNDLVDHELLTYLAMPCAVCTNEQPSHRKIRVCPRTAAAKSTGLPSSHSFLKPITS